MKMLFDYTRLIDKIYADGGSAASVSSALGISEKQWMQRIAGLEEFSQEEIALLTEEVLHIDPAEIPAYFFHLGGV